MKPRFFLVLVAALLVVAAFAVPLHAQEDAGGCPSSPTTTPTDQSQPDAQPSATFTTPTTPATLTAPPIPPRVEGPSGVVALTFDAGADRGYAEDILDTLSDNQIPATFGMTGRWAEANPELVQRMASDGHMVINHTYDHRSFTGLSDRLGGLSAERRQEELEQADGIITPLIGHTTCPWYRLPYGDSDARAASDASEIGYTMQVGWNVDTLGWRGVPVQSIVDRSLRLSAPNAIYVMHVGAASRDGPALQSIIDGLRAQGYGFATVAALYVD